MGMLMVWPAIGWDIRMFHIRPIDPTGGRKRKNTWNEIGCAEYAGCKTSGTP
jgi:hypothetical protein